MYLSTPPSVTVDRYRLWTKPSVTTRDSSNSKNFWAHFQFHSYLSHHDVLEDECHRLCWSGWRRSSICSPDSWRKRFLIETAALKSDRSFMGPFLPALFRTRCHCPWCLFSSGVIRCVWSSFASSSHSWHCGSVHPIASCDSRWGWFSDLFHKLLNSEMFCLFHNCVWQSWNLKSISCSSIWSTCKVSPYLLIFFNLCGCQHATFCGF